MKHYSTIGDMLKACQACKTKEDAEEVLRKGEEDNPGGYTKGNVGYILGYLGQAERERLYALFSDCVHPVFGAGFGRGQEPTPEEAFEAGQQLTKNSK